MNRERRGFTLVELLVVIAIIALLMSILLPAMTRVRNQAKNVLCQANLKQWGVCFAMYVDENEGSFMPGWCTDTYPSNELHKFYWMEALRSCYGNQHELRCCPTAMKPGTEIVPGAQYGGNGTFSAWGVFGTGWGYAVPGDYGSYGWNGWCGNPPPGTPKDLGEEHPTAWNWRKADVKGAGDIPLMLDEQWVDGWPHHTDSPPVLEGQAWWITKNEHMGRFCSTNRHSGSLNGVFVDFSVRRIGLKQLWKLKWNRLYDLNGPWTEAGGVTRTDWPEWMRVLKDYE